MSTLKQTCQLCNEELLPTHRVLPIRCDAGADENPPYVHLECVVRSVIGSVGHQSGQCSCYGRIDRSEEGLTPRQASVAAFAYFELHGGRI